MIPSSRPFSIEGRRDNLTEMASTELDVLVIGGGITGAGVALEASRRGLRVGLLEARDFAFGTSSRSSKLVHGGIRYLAQGEVGLVFEALQERHHLAVEFPDLVHRIRFLMPIPPGRRAAWTLKAGLVTYDALSIGSGFPHHHRVAPAEAHRLAPALLRSDVRGAWAYWDAQTDDAALTVAVLRRAHRNGALVANYVGVTGVEHAGGRWRVRAVEQQSGASLVVSARRVVNAAGVWAEAVEGLSGRPPRARLSPSKGVHISIAHASLPIDVAMIFPVGDGRVLFAIPWHGYIIVGTTDVAYDGDLSAPRCSPADEDMMLTSINRFFGLALDRDAVLSRWAGVRPLVAGRGGATKDLSRKPFIAMDDRGLMTVTGGKLTTFMRMAREAVEGLGLAAGRSPEWAADPVSEAPLASTGELLPGEAGYTMEDAVAACDDGMALELDDILARRMRLSFLDVAAAATSAEQVLGPVSRRLGWRDGPARLTAFRVQLEAEFGPALASTAT
ncbi:MAG: glycerol-3-phosphate dehydrogenase/oxidase [Candidatus Dormibacteria bacterium]